MRMLSLSHRVSTAVLVLSTSIAFHRRVAAVYLRINAGGSNYTDSNGNLWVSDANYVNTGLRFVTSAKINGTNDEGLYQSERWDVLSGPSMIYDIPLPDGIYDVLLHWAEVYSKAQEPKKRVFDVFIEDELVFEDLDIFSLVGGYHPLVKQTTAVVQDGALTIRYRHKIGDPKVNAIEIRLTQPSDAPSMEPSISAYPTAPTNSPVPSQVPSMAPSTYPTETPLPWTDLGESRAYTARHECSFVQAGDRFYYFGGREKPRKLEIYDYKTNTWSRGASAPKSFNHFQAVSHEGLIWVIGAFESNNFPDEKPADNVYVYDPANDVWMVGPTITWSRGSGGLVVYNDKFYLIGGNTDGHDGGFVQWLDEYDPRTNKWTILPDAPHARDHFHAVVIGNKLYAAGGRRTIRRNTFGDTVKEVDVYDFQMEEWLPPELSPRDLPVPRAAAATAVFEGKLMLMGGEARENATAFSRVDALDPSTGRWSTLTPMNHRRHGTQAIVSGKGVYVTGGSPRRGGGRQKKMEVYNEDHPIGIASEGGELGVLSIRAGSSVTIKHVSGNQGVFVNSVKMEGQTASDFVITNEVQSRFLIPRDATFRIAFEYKGAAYRAKANVVVTYSSNKVLNITLSSSRSS